MARISNLHLICVQRVCDILYQKFHMTNGFGKLLFQNHNGSMRITRSPFIRSFIRIFITGKTCSYMYTTSALHNLKVSRAEISTVFFMKRYISVFLSNNQFVKRTYMRYAQLSLNALLYFQPSIVRVWCFLLFFFGKQQDLFSNGRKWYIFLSGFLGP